MDEGCSKAVREVLLICIIRPDLPRNRIINWCPDCTTALSMPR